MQETFEYTILVALEYGRKNGVDIGAGRTATVSIVPGSETVCLKTVKNKEISVNRAHAERRFLDELFGEELLAPRPVCSIETDEFDFLFMETIRGFSIKDLIEKDLYDQLPENFDFKSFLSALTQSVELLHDRRIFHRDLHSGNIMINLDQPNKPVIIDFGDAVKQFLSSEDPYCERIKGKTVIFPDDHENIRQTRLDLEQYLQKKGRCQKQRGKNI